jgi:hypothetical protein
MSTLSDTRIVDLNRSVLDKEKSKPKANRYVFEKKRYVDMDLMQEDNVWFCWCHWDPKSGNEMFNGWKLDGWDGVISQEDPYIVEGAFVNSDGLWQYKDVVLMKCKWEDEVKRREESLRMATGGKERLRAFAREMDGIDPQFTQGAGIGPDEMADLRNRNYKR